MGNNRDIWNNRPAPVDHIPTWTEWRLEVRRITVSGGNTRGEHVSVSSASRRSTNQSRTQDLCGRLLNAAPRENRSHKVALSSLPRSVLPSSSSFDESQRGLWAGQTLCQHRNTRYLMQPGHQAAVWTVALWWRDTVAPRIDEQILKWNFGPRNGGCCLFEWSGRRYLILWKTNQSKKLCQ